MTARPHAIARVSETRPTGGQEDIATNRRHQIVDGTDLPYIWPVTVDLVLNASFLSDADKEAIVGGNLIRLLRIPAQA